MERRMAVVIVALFTGVGAGAVASELVGSVASAQASCPYEWWQGDNSQNSKYDDTDGVDEDNAWYARGAADTLRSLACDDRHVDGEGENDDVGGGSSNDNVYGGGGHDVVYGGAGSYSAVDGLHGGDGPDDIYDAETYDYDYMWGDAGNDMLDARDGDDDDSLTGGTDSDYCYKNSGDQETQCELP